jgi:uncharacterized cupredoxin-like copper-binding protein
MKLRTFSLALLVTAVGLVLAPVAISKPAASQATTVLVTAKEFKFTLSKRSVPKGVVTFKVTNKGKLPHDFKISGKKTAMLKPGKTATLKVTLSKGAKGYLCTVPGHAAAGMKGSLRVT